MSEPIKPSPGEREPMVLVYTGDGPIPEALKVAVDKVPGITFVDAKERPDMVILTDGFGPCLSKELLASLKAIEVVSGLDDVLYEGEPSYRKLAHKGRGRWPRS